MEHDIFIDVKKNYLLETKHKNLLPHEIESISKILTRYVSRSGKSARQALGELAEETGISESTLWAIKTLKRHPTKKTLPNPTYDIVCKIIDATGYEGAYFPKDEPEKD